MSSKTIKWAVNLFRSSSITFKQPSLIFYGDQEILPHKNNTKNKCLSKNLKYIWKF